MGPCPALLAHLTVAYQTVAAILTRSLSAQFCNNRASLHHPILSPTASAIHHIQHCNHMDNLRSCQSELARALEQALERGLALGLEVVRVLSEAGLLAVARELRAVMS